MCEMLVCMSQRVLIFSPANLHSKEHAKDDKSVPSSVLYVRDISRVCITKTSVADIYVHVLFSV